MEKIFFLIFIGHFIFFAEGSCDNFKNDVVLLIATMMIVKYFRQNVFKNKLTRFFFLVVNRPTPENANVGLFLQFRLSVFYHFIVVNKV